MAVTLDQLQAHPKGFINNAYSADLSGCEEIVPAVTGKSIYVESISVSCVAAITITIGAGETAGAVTDEVFGPLQFAATAPGFVREVFPKPIKLAAAVALVADASGAGAATIMAQGYIE